MNFTERLETLMKILDRLCEDSEAGLPIIVEGRADVEVLRSLGVRGRIFTVKERGKSLVDVVDEVRGVAEEAIILVDFDRRGREYALKLTKSLQMLGVKPNLSYWKEIMCLVGKWVKDVEGLPSYIETLKRKVCCY